MLFPFFSFFFGDRGWRCVGNELELGLSGVEMKMADSCTPQTQRKPLPPQQQESAAHRRGAGEHKERLGEQAPHTTFALYGIPFDDPRPIEHRLTILAKLGLGVRGGVSLMRSWASRAMPVIYRVSGQALPHVRT